MTAGDGFLLEQASCHLVAVFMLQSCHEGPSGICMVTAGWLEYGVYAVEVCYLPLTTNVTAMVSSCWLAAC